MLDLKFVRENPDAVRRSIELRHMKADVDAILSLYKRRNELVTHTDALRQESNNIAKNMKSASADERPALIEKGKQLKEDIRKAEQESEEIEPKLKELLMLLPNLLPEDTPRGEDEEGNVLVRKYKKPTSFDFEPKDHVELGEMHDLLDFESGAKVAGTKFYYMKNDLVLLEIAIEQLAFTIARKYGFKPLQTPDLARQEILSGSGFNPRGEESNIYNIEDTDLSLIATAEITTGGLHSDTIFAEDELPLKYVAKSHCYRREAGASGRASKGLYRVHQFTKVELYQFCHPDRSGEALEEILALEEEFYKALQLPYRVMRVCAGDMGAPAYKKYDIEVWMPGKGEKGEYGEVTSCSNCTDFQARRLNVRYKEAETGKNIFVHTLNGTATALSRTLLSIMENFQQADGTIVVPRSLRKFFGGQQTIPAIIT